MSVLLGLVLAACGVDEVSATGGGSEETGSETGDSGELPDPGYCVGTDEDWSSARTGYQRMVALWSDGEQFLAHGNRTLISYDGETVEFHEDATVSTTLRELEATAIDDAWLVRPNSIEHWDGHTSVPVVDEVFYPEVEISPDGQVWALFYKPCSLFECVPRIWRRVDDETWELEPMPAVDETVEFTLSAGPDGELWVSDSSSLLHRTSGGAWITLSLWEQTGWDWFQGVYARALDVDAGGHLWFARDSYEAIYLGHRTPADAWVDGGSHQLTPSEVFGPTQLIADGDAVNLFRADGRGHLFRYDGGPDVEPLVTLDQLETVEITAVSGRGDRLALLSPGPRVDFVEPEAAGTPTIETALDLHGLAPSRGAALTVDSPYAASDNALMRFDGQRWSQVLTVEGPAWNMADIGDISIDDAASGWLITGEPYADIVIGDRVRRFVDGELVDEWQPSFGPMWLETNDAGTWVIGSRALGPGPATLDTHVWRHDGEQWIEILVEAGSLPVATASDSDELFVLEYSGEVTRFTVDGHESLAPVGGYVADWHESKDRGDLIARVGDELLYSWAEDVLRLVDGEWVEVEDLPALRRLENDPFGRAWAIADGAVYRHDGTTSADTGWERVELEGVDSDAMITATRDGAIVHAATHTSVFRWGCS